MATPPRRGAHMRLPAVGGVLIIVVKFSSLQCELENFNNYGTYKSVRFNKARA